MLAKQMPNYISALLQINQQTEHKKKVLNYLSKLHPEIDFSNYPDLLIYNSEQDSLKIKTVREIIQQHQFANYQNQTRFVVILRVDLASIPAQNALLKLLEEPAKDTKIILTTVYLNKILSTILSRCQLVKTNLLVQNNKHKKSKIDLPLKSYSQLIEFAEKHKDRNTAQQLILDLLSHYHQQITQDQTNINLIKTLLKAYNRLEQNANVRLVLENCFFQMKQLLAK